MLEKVDRICAEVGRDSKEIERSVAPLVRMTGGKGRPSGDPKMSMIAPISGEPETLAAELRALAEMGIAHVQLVLDPITIDSIAELAPMLALLDQ